MYHLPFSLHSNSLYICKLYASIFRARLIMFQCLKLVGLLIAKHSYICAFIETFFSNINWERLNCVLLRYPLKNIGISTFSYSILILPLLPRCEKAFVSTHKLKAYLHCIFYTPCFCDFWRRTGSASLYFIKLDKFQISSKFNYSYIATMLHPGNVYCSYL